MSSIRFRKDTNEFDFTDTESEDEVSFMYPKSRRKGAFIFRNKSKSNRYKNRKKRKDNQGSFNYEIDDDLEEGRLKGLRNKMRNKMRDFNISEKIDKAREKFKVDDGNAYHLAATIIFGLLTTTLFGFWIASFFDFSDDSWQNQIFTWKAWGNEDFNSKYIFGLSTLFCFITFISHLEQHLGLFSKWEGKDPNNKYDSDDKLIRRRFYEYSISATIMAYIMLNSFNFEYNDTFLKKGPVNYFIDLLSAGTSGILIGKTFYNDGKWRYSISKFLLSVLWVSFTIYHYTIDKISNGHLGLLLGVFLVTLMLGLCISSEDKTENYYRINNYLIFLSALVIIVKPYIDNYSLVLFLPYMQYFGVVAEFQKKDDSKFGSLFSTFVAWLLFAPFFVAIVLEIISFADMIDNFENEGLFYSILVIFILELMAFTMFGLLHFFKIIGSCGNCVCFGNSERLYDNAEVVMSIICKIILVALNVCVVVSNTN